MLSHYYRNRKNKTLPVLKTEKDLEAEGLARLSIDLPSFQVTDEPDSAITASPTAASGHNSFVLENPAILRPKAEGHAFTSRYSIGFDVPGAVHTIMTPSKYGCH